MQAKLSGSVLLREMHSQYELFSCSRAVSQVKSDGIHIMAVLSLKIKREFPFQTDHFRFISCLNLKAVCMSGIVIIKSFTDQIFRNAGWLVLFF